MKLILCISGWLSSCFIISSVIELLIKNHDLNIIVSFILGCPLALLWMAIYANLKEEKC